VRIFKAINPYIHWDASRAL